MVVEKAFAKLHGCYEALAGGQVRVRGVRVGVGVGLAATRRSPAGRSPTLRVPLPRTLPRTRTRTRTLTPTPTLTLTLGVRRRWGGVATPVASSPTGSAAATRATARGSAARRRRGCMRRASGEREESEEPRGRHLRRAELASEFCFCSACVKPYCIVVGCRHTAGVPATRQKSCISRLQHTGHEALTQHALKNE